MKCTMKGCRGNINGWSGLQELQSLMKHFQRKHKTPLSMQGALQVRLDIEDGKEPSLIRAMLGDVR